MMWDFCIHKVQLQPMFFGTGVGVNESVRDLGPVKHVGRLRDAKNINSSLAERDQSSKSTAPMLFVNAQHVFFALHPPYPYTYGIRFQLS